MSATTEFPTIDLSTIPAQDFGSICGIVHSVTRYEVGGREYLSVCIDDAEGDAHLVLVDPQHVYPCSPEPGQQAVAIVAPGVWCRGQWLAKRISVFVDPPKPEPVEPLVAPWVWPPAPHDLAGILPCGARRWRAPVEDDLPRAC